MLNDIRVSHYKNRYIVATTFGFRVKSHPEDDYALHHGTFETEALAKAWIDKLAGTYKRT
jgi:hypothetical protein